MKTIEQIIGHPLYTSVDGLLWLAERASVSIEVQLDTLVLTVRVNGTGDAYEVTNEATAAGLMFALADAARLVVGEVQP